MRPAFFCDLPPGPLGVAVSGGGDSLALLVLMRDAGLTLAVATVDHGLRPEAAAEAALVARFCAQWSIPHDTLRLNLAPGGNIQARGRDARYHALSAWAKTKGLAAVALGHTADDVAETFLMRLSRGSGARGLSAMAAQVRHYDTVFVRPVLDRSRADLRKVLTARQIDWVDDPTNDDPKHLRVQMRQAKPAFDALGLTQTRLVDTAQRMTRVCDALDHLLRLAGPHIRFDRGCVRIPKTLGDWPLDTQLRLWADTLRWVGRAAYPPREAEVLAAMATRSDRTLQGCHILMDQENFVICRELAATPEPTTGRIWDGWLLEGPQVPGDLVQALGHNHSLVDWRGTGLPLQTVQSAPSVWRNGTLLSCPIAQPNGPFSARIATPYPFWALPR